MNPQFWWYVSRATGLVAWALSAFAVLWGMALATRALGAKPKAPWLLDLHRFVGGLTVLFVAAHMGALVADSYVEFGLADLLVPLRSDWKPGPVAWGIVAMYGLLAIELTSLFMSRLPKKLWHGVHLTSYLVFVGATVHLFTAGTDAGNPLVILGTVSIIAVTGFFAVYRWVGPGRVASVRASKAAAKARRAEHRAAATVPTSPASPPATTRPATTPTARIPAAVRERASVDRPRRDRIPAAARERAAAAKASTIDPA